MKLKSFLFALPIALFVFTSCDDSASEKTSETTNNRVETAKKECKIQSMAFKLGEKSRRLDFKYKEGKLSKVETIENGVDLNQTMAYNFHDHGGIQAFLSGSVIAAYIYDDENKVLKINGEKGLSTRTFEYNEKGQIVKQITVNNGRPYIIHEYKYNENAQPVEVAIYDNTGELTEVNQIKYDGKNNPFKNTGVFVNSMEMLLGFAVGNQNHNVVEIDKTYKKNTTYKINGEYKKSGEREVNKIEYVYNENDYPVEVIRMRSGNQTRMRLAYKCD